MLLCRNKLFLSGLFFINCRNEQSLTALCQCLCNVEPIWRREEEEQEKTGMCRAQRWLEKQKVKTFFSFFIEAAACGGNSVVVVTRVEVCSWFVWSLQLDLARGSLQEVHKVGACCSDFIRLLFLWSFCDVTEVIWCGNCWCGLQWQDPRNHWYILTGKLPSYQNTAPHFESLFHWTEGFVCNSILEICCLFFFFF